MPSELRKEFRYQINIAIIVLGILFSIGVVFSLNGSWVQLRLKQTEVNSLESKVSALEDLVEKRQTLEPEFNQLSSFFPRGESGVAQVAEKLEEQAILNGLSMVLNFEDFPDQVDIGGVYQPALGFNVVIEGPYQSVVSWVRGIEALPFFITIAETKIGLPAEGTGVKAEFEGLIFLSKTTEG